MVVVSCLTKFHSFVLAEQLNKHRELSAFYTVYAYQKNKLFRKLAKRVDKERIPPQLIHTNLVIAAGLKLIKKDFTWIEHFDQWVASQIRRQDNYKVFIGWSSMSLHALRAAKKAGKITIVERGSSHIQYQDRILSEEYKKFGINFSINKQIVEKELKEYEEADYISIPSTFVKNSFLAYGVPESKLIQNAYGVSSFFVAGGERKSKKFTILYLGTLSIQKGLVYFWEALKTLGIPEEEYEVWFIGTVEEELRPTLAKYNAKNWHFFGHINHYQLGQYLNSADIAVQPSLQEGLSMVIPQLLSCGIPVIATTNTGAMDIIENDKSGFIIPIRSPSDIAEKIQFLYYNPEVRNQMRENAVQSIHKGYTWDHYGERYVNFLRSIT
jgi:glycosyltransferase involved in cell wall biosynthesis